MVVACRSGAGAALTSERRQLVAALVLPDATQDLIGTALVRRLFIGAAHLVSLAAIHGGLGGGGGEGRDVMNNGEGVMIQCLPGHETPANSPVARPQKDAPALASPWGIQFLLSYIDEFRI